VLGDLDAGNRAREMIVEIRGQVLVHVGVCSRVSPARVVRSVTLLLDRVRNVPDELNA